MRHEFGVVLFGFTAMSRWSQITGRCKKKPGEPGIMYKCLNGFEVWSKNNPFISVTAVPGKTLICDRL